MVVRNPLGTKRLSVGQQLAAIEAGIPTSEAEALLKQPEGAAVFSEQGKVRKSMRLNLEEQAGILEEDPPSSDSPDLGDSEAAPQNPTLNQLMSGIRTRVLETLYRWRTNLPFSNTEVQ